MKKFLESVAEYIIENHKTGLHELCIVFPNRRSGSFFTSYLQKLLEKEVIGPSVITVNDLMMSFSKSQITDRLKLVSILYEEFATHSKPSESFDDFYYWGEILLSDFDDIDKYLVSPADIFRNISDLKEIDYLFNYLEESQKEVLRRFWGSLGRWEGVKNKEEFLKTWKKLEPAYSGFRERLKKEGIAYYGMALREIAEKIKQGDGPPLTFKKYYIVGLNALNECEKVFFRYLQQSGKAVFLWDYDLVYINDPKQEAGLFIRENLETFPPPEDFTLSSECFQTKKNIEFIAVPSSYGQAQVIPAAMESIKKDYSPVFDNTAIVLADESLLFPVLGAIPEKFEKINVTMGYPVRNSSVYGFIGVVASLVKNTKVVEGQKYRFYYRFVFDILQHQLLAGIESEKVHQFLNNAKKNNQVYISPDDICFSQLHIQIFNLPEKAEEYGGYFLGILRLLYAHLEKHQPGNKVLPELLATMYQAIEQLNMTISEVQGQTNQVISKAIFFRLLFQYISQVSVSYEGEPLTGLQVMGVLETRCLDFKNIIILGLNEDFWPRPSSAPSYIPNNLRYAFSLPSIDDHNAMYAYYFYRLIQRAKNVTAAYSTVKESLNTGELSRFGYQLMYDSAHTIHLKNIEFEFKSNPQKPLEAKSSPAISEKLLLRYSLKPLSPSALNIYINCKYRFYLRYVVGLPDKDEIKEEVDGQMFGNIFHSAMEYLYSGKKILTDDLLTRLIKDKKIVEKAIYEALATEYFKLPRKEAPGIALEGNVRLIFEYIKTYILQLLKVDKEVAPVEMVSLENKYSVTANLETGGKKNQVLVGGIIDRLDRVAGRLRIIDYKTGNVKSLVFKDVPELFDCSAKEPKKEILQALAYSYIIKRGYYPNEPVDPAVYDLKKLFGNNHYPYVKQGREQLNFDKILDEFEENLVSLLQEIFSPENVFYQTGFTGHCRTCPYRLICHRG